MPEPFIEVSSAVHHWDEPWLPNHVYRVSGGNWIPGTMVFITWEFWRNKVVFPLTDAGASCMASNPGGRVDCYWMDNGVSEVPVTDEHRRVTATTNDGTGRTATALIQGPISEFDPEP